MPIPQLKSSRNSSWKEGSRESNKKVSSSYSRKKSKKTIKMILLKAALYLAALFTVLIIITMLWISRDLPNPNQLIEREVAQSTKIYDRTGENIIYEISGEQRRTLIKL